ncbi:hypothetical protein WA026_017024 [Henosepilachna vigintioctopunctata]|uniref:Uncharacterized protein n=1 Tax=Henosepilachna vigintioctopunctata TaxID=420089 RepID=A0AAW1TVX7_9CUCU
MICQIESEIKPKVPLIMLELFIECNHLLNNAFRISIYLSVKHTVSMNDISDEFIHSNSKISPDVSDNYIRPVNYLIRGVILKAAWFSQSGLLPPGVLGNYSRGNNYIRQKPSVESSRAG